MRHRCPNCFECVPFRRIFTLTRQWRCAHCDALLEMRENSRGNFLIFVGFVTLGLLALTWCVLVPQIAPAWPGSLPRTLGETGALLGCFLVWMLGMYVAMRLVDNVVVVGESCRQCGYHLRGLTEPRCPECGTEFTLPSSGEQSPPTDN